jgi:putative restriction endonuclease
MSKNPVFDAQEPKYWWVSHNQKHRDELEGGYIWCPQTTSTGGRRETWTNVSRVSKGDIIFSYARTKIQAVGIATMNAVDAPAPEGYSSWNDHGWRVAIKWERLENPFSPKDRWNEIARLFPSVHSPMREDGDGNLTYLAALSDTLGLKLLEIAGLENEDAVAMVDRDIVEQAGLERTEIERVYQARIGQGLYRRNVIDVESRCRVTRVANLDLLVASHIKPWRQSSNRERLDGNNGLMLSPHIDKLFDAGWISFSDIGDVLVATPEIQHVLSVWGVDPNSNVGPFNEEQSKYLAYHREKLFSPKRSSAN